MAGLKYLERPYLKELVELGIADISSLETSIAFDDHLCTHYPWVPVTMDSIHWQELENVIRLHVSPLLSPDLFSQDKNEEIYRYFKKTRLGKHTYAAVTYSAREPCLICELEYVAYNFKKLFWGAVSAHYIFGVDKKGDEYQYFFDDFVESDDDDQWWLSGIKI